MPNVKSSRLLFVLVIGASIATHTATVASSPSSAGETSALQQQRFVTKAATSAAWSLSLSVGDDSRFGGLARPDGSSAIRDASFLVTHGPQDPDTTVFLHFGSRPSNGQYGFNSLNPLAIDTTAYHSGTGCAHAIAHICTRDSAVGATIDWVFPQDPDLDEFILARCTFYRYNPNVDVTNLDLGLLIETDIRPATSLGTIQDGVTNQAGFDYARNLAWVGGVDTVGHQITGNRTATRFRAGVAISGGLIGAFTGNSTTDLQAGGGPTDGFLYGVLQNVEEFELGTQSDTDLYVMLSLDRGRSIAVGETLSYTIIFVSDTVSGASLVSTADQALVVAPTLCMPCTCPCQFDPQCDGTLSNIQDVVKVIDIAFRGIPPTDTPLCPNESTDVDADGTTSVTDVVKVINVAFRGQSVAANYVDPCGQSVRSERMKILPTSISFSRGANHCLLARELRFRGLDPRFDSPEGPTYV